MTDNRIPPEEPHRTFARYVHNTFGENVRLRARVDELLAANNLEMNRRRTAEKEARRCRKALARVKHAADTFGHLHWSLVGQIIEPALAGQDGPEHWNPKE